MTEETRVPVAALPKLLGVSERTVRNRLRELDIETFTPYADRRTRYIRKSDLHKLGPLADDVMVRLLRMRDRDRPS